MFMLCARRKLDGQTVTAYMESRTRGPFICPECNEEVILKSGRLRINHFAHANPLACRLSEGESEEHRRCKMEIYLALQGAPGVRNVALERALGEVRPDVSAEINGVPVAIEVQISSLSLDTITRRTIDYFRKGIYVLWLLQWAPQLDERRYSPRLWERWIHAAYFGCVYYWVKDRTVLSYHFDPSLTSIPKTSWRSRGGRKITAGGYSRRHKRFRMAIRGQTFDLASDFGPRERYWWQGTGSKFKLPDAKLFMHRSNPTREALY